MCELHLTDIDGEGWLATFRRDAMLAHDGFGTDRTPCGGVQQAAWEELMKRLTRRQSKARATRSRVP